MMNPYNLSFKGYPYLLHTCTLNEVNNMQIRIHKAVKVECMQDVHITIHFRTFPPTCALTCGVKVLKM